MTAELCLRREFLKDQPNGEKNSPISTLLLAGAPEGNADIFHSKCTYAAFPTEESKQEHTRLAFFSMIFRI